LILPAGHELLDAPAPPGPFRTVLFDFDGTLSLLREGWPEVMIDLMVEALGRTPGAEAADRLHAFALAFIMRLNGQPTIVQMAQLASEVRQRGGQAEPPEAYKAEYLRRLMKLVEPRRQAIAGGTATPEQWTVAGARTFLSKLRGAGVRLVLASGTDLDDVRKEVALLELAEFFGDDIHAAVADGSFSKPGLIAKLLSAGQGPLLGFGDGMVETSEVRRVGGLAVGVASDLAHPGRINPWKRPQLAAAGAHLLIPDFREADWLYRFTVHGV
jgi:phosphoglycolate phosphatase